MGCVALRPCRWGMTWPRLSNGGVGPFGSMRLKNLRIALVESSVPTSHVFSRVYLPRTGIPTLAALARELGHECDLWFQAVSPLDAERLGRYDVVGIGSLTNTVTEAYKLADACRKGGATVVMGGPHATFNFQEALEHCDYVVRGEGEVAFPALLDALANGGAVEDIPGLACRDSSGEVQSNGFAETPDFAELPSPDFSGSPQLTRTPPIVVTSRGCPHHCKFCAVTPMFGRKYRFKSNEQVIAELRPVLSRSVCFGDDNFCANASRTKGLLRQMIAEDAVPLRWAAQMCVKSASDAEMLDLMQETRCRIAYVGIESIIASRLEDFGKPHDVDAIARCVKGLHEHGVGIHGMFIVCPDDDLAVARGIVDYAIKTDLDTIQICSLTPFPGCGSYEQWEDRLLHRNWQYFDGLHVVVRPTKCTPLEMHEAVYGAMKRFYSLPRALGAYRLGRRWRMKYRLGGWYLVRKWLKENAEYIEYLRGESGEG